MRVDLLRSSPFRLTLVLGTAFLIALLVAVAVGYQLVRREFDARTDRDIADTYSVIRQSLGDSDIGDLAALVQSHADAAIRHDRVYLLRDGNGAILAGNIDGAALPLGWSTVEADTLGLDSDLEYRVFVGAADGNTILIGTSSAEADAIGRLALTGMAWAALLFLIIAGSAGALIATRAQRRLEAIAGTMDRVGRGELSARIPISAAADDIDRLAGQVNAALDRLLALVEGMRQVSTDIAHDLKTPLNRLSIMIDGATTAEAEGKEVSGELAAAQREVLAINATFDALLRIAQIEAGARRSRFARLSLTPILRNVWEVYADAAAQAGQTLDLRVADDLPPIAGDRELLTQMVANLVENAIRHAGRGAGIVIAASAGRDRLRLEIIDNGPGIPPEEWARVFRRLYRLDKSRSTPGSGLGLSLSKAVAELHGARITLADNEPGLKVSIDIPLATASPHKGLPIRKADDSVA